MPIDSERCASCLGRAVWERRAVFVSGGRIPAQGACFIDSLMPPVTGELQPTGGSIWIMEYP